MRWVVLDTDVASRNLRNRLSPAMSARLSGAVWFVTFVTVGELWQWADARSWGWQTREGLEDWLSHTVVIDSDDGVSREWGRSAAAARARARPRPTNDSWIAACCVARGLPLATYNVKDYEYHAEHDGLVLVTE